MESTNKKRTAVVAAATAAALLLSGTFAWNMATDKTKLNEFSESDKGNYGVELKENFDPNDPWANKDVYVTNTKDNPVIVRVRLEEFYDLTYRNGTEYNKPEGYANGDADGSAIFTPDADDTLNDDNTADSATKLNEKISLLFGAGVVTMAEYNAMDADSKAEVKWVVDTDGWCYYTQALLAGETTEYLLDKATFNKDVFDAAYDSPYNLDYRINVRLQAISADLEDFGSHLNDMQWTNVAYIDDYGNEVRDDKGRVIAEDNRADDYEILDDSTITNEALDLVIGIHNTYTNPYANVDGTIAVKVSTAQQLIDAIDEFADYSNNIHSILLTDNIVIDDDTFFGSLNVYQDLLIDLGEYSITRTDTGSSELFVVEPGVNLTIKHGNIVTNGQDLVRNDGTVTLVGVDANTGDGWGVWLHAADSGVEMYGSTVNSLCPIAVQAGADNSSIYLNNSSIIANGEYNTASQSIVNNSANVNAAKNVSIVSENSSRIESQNMAICPLTGWTLNLSDTTLTGDEIIKENHDYPPESVAFKNCNFETTGSIYFKVADSPLTMENCKLDVRAVTATGGYGMGLFLRSGDITLNNVELTVHTGENDRPKTVETMNSRYSTRTSGCTINYEPIQVVLNSYESINLNIIGGSYVTEVNGTNDVYVNSVYVFDANGTYPYGAIYAPRTYDYNNTITLSPGADGNMPFFSPTAIALNPETPYANTTVTYVPATTP
ncbi:MAG: hypothetical protein ACI4FO_01780 [Acutalibacteraceae bacterium]